MTRHLVFPQVFDRFITLITLDMLSLVRPFLVQLEVRGGSKELVAVGTVDIFGGGTSPTTARGGKLMTSFVNSHGLG